MSIKSIENLLRVQKTYLTSTFSCRQCYGETATSYILLTLTSYKIIVWLYRYTNCLALDVISCHVGTQEVSMTTHLRIFKNWSTYHHYVLQHVPVMLFCSEDHFNQGVYTSVLCYSFMQRKLMCSAGEQRKFEIYPSLYHLGSVFKRFWLGLLFFRRWLL